MVAVARRIDKRMLRRPIAVSVAGALWDWNGSTVDREGIGASEEMIVRLGEKLVAEQPYDVFGPVPEEEVYKGVGYWPRAAIRHAPADAKVVVSRAPGYVRQVDQWIGTERPAVLWLQDTLYPDLNAEVADRYESVVCLSNWHRELTIQAHKLRRDQEDKVKVAYNWIDRGHFEAGIESGWKDIKLPHHFIYASSPDRGLVKLLELWPRVLEIYPDATLSIFYGWRGAAKLGGGLDAAWNQRYLKARRRYEELRHQKGLKEVGMVNHLQLALEFQKASAWLYPTDFHETGCLTAVKARAAGCVPVTSALAALNETAACEQAVLVDLVNEDGTHREGYDDAWLSGLQRAVETPLVDRQAMARDTIKQFSWEAVELVWKEILA